MNLDPALLEILICPQCRSSLAADDEARELICGSCSLAYPVRADDVPVMLVEMAREL